MKRQRIRYAALFLSMLLFPVTIYYLSPYLIIQASFSGVIAGSFVFFAVLFLTSLIFGRAYCGWLCPAGALQRYCAQINGKRTGPKMNNIKIFIWIPWLIAIVSGFIAAGGIKSFEPFYFTDHGISVSNIYGYIIYFFIVGLILAVSLIHGKRAFCHSLCWMAPFMMIGTKIKNKLKYPSLHLEAVPEECISCRTCDRNCPMSLEVSQMVKTGKMDHSECMLCGKCENVCNKNVIKLSFKTIKR